MSAFAASFLEGQKQRKGKIISSLNKSINVFGSLNNVQSTQRHSTRFYKPTEASVSLRPHRHSPETWTWRRESLSSGLCAYSSGCLGTRKHLVLEYSSSRKISRLTSTITEEEKVWITLKHNILLNMGGKKHCHREAFHISYTYIKEYLKAGGAPFPGVIYTNVRFVEKRYTP